jgi:hypothetical protein
MPANPVEAGRKGGQSRSAKKLAACRRNGFQKVTTQPSNAENLRASIPLLFTARKDSDANAS